MRYVRNGWVSRNLFNFNTVWTFLITTCGITLPVPFFSSSFCLTPFHWCIPVISLASCPIVVTKAAVSRTMTSAKMLQNHQPSSRRDYPFPFTVFIGPKQLKYSWVTVFCPKEEKAISHKARVKKVAETDSSRSTREKEKTTVVFLKISSKCRNMDDLEKHA